MKKEIVRQVGQTVRESLGSIRRTICLCMIEIAAGTAVGISRHLGR